MRPHLAPELIEQDINTLIAALGQARIEAEQGSFIDLLEVDKKINAVCRAVEIAAGNGIDDEMASRFENGLRTLMAVFDGLETVLRARPLPQPEPVGS